MLRVAVLRNLDEPGAAPGASATNPVTDLIDAVGGGLGPIGKILDVVYKVAGRRYGYEVTTDISVDDVAHCTTVLVKLKSIAGEQTFATERSTATPTSRRCASAGLWAAGKILERSSRIPSWAAWNAYTAEALSTAFLEDPTTAQLEAAVANAPGSGLLLAMLGQRYERAGPAVRRDRESMPGRSPLTRATSSPATGSAPRWQPCATMWRGSRQTRSERAQLWRWLERAALALHIPRDAHAEAGGVRPSG